MLHEPRQSSAGQLMNGSAHFVADQRGNDALDLAPVAEPDHIARTAALLGAIGGFYASTVAESVDQKRRIVERRSSANIWCGHGAD